MKKILMILIVLSLLFAITSCADKTQRDDFVSRIEKDLGSTPKVEQETPNPLGFENLKLYSAVCKALGKNEKAVTQEDILNIKYISLDIEDNGECTVYLGLLDYIDVYFELVKNPDDAELSKKLVLLARKASFEYNKDEDVFSDIAKFTKVNVFEYYDIPITDVSFLKNLNELYFGYFDSNGITDISSLSGYNPETLRELDFTGNDIEDWSALENIKEKVIVHYEVQEYDNGKGDKIQVPFVLKLSDKLKQDKEREEKEKNQQSNDDKQQPPAFVDRDGNPVDFGSLFE